MTKRFTSLAVSLAMLLTIVLTGCGAGANKKTEATSGAKSSEPLTLETYIMYGGTGDAVETNWMTSIYKDKLNIILKNTKLAGDNANQKMQALMASGSLPDIVGFNDVNFSNNAAAAGLVLPLDDNKSKLPNIFANPFYKNALEFSKVKLSGGKNKIFILPTVIGTQDFINYSPQLRWDLYQKLGSPKIATLEDYLPVLKKMQDMNPVNDKGQKVYGVSIFGDWDSNNMALASFLIPLYGYDNEYVNPLVETKVDGSEAPKSIFDDNSLYKRALKFYYKANQMGILDPDSLTQKWDNVSEKYKAGRILFSPWDWASGSYNTIDHASADKPTGYDAVWADDFKLPISPDQTVGRSWSLAIGASTKNKDAALKFLDYFYSVDGQDMLQNGPKGLIWDDTNGERAITDTGWDYLDNNKDLPGGGKLADALGFINAPSITSSTINSKTGKVLANSQLDSTKNHKLTKIRQSWSEANGGAKTAIDAGKLSGKLIKSTQAVNMLPALPDDLQNIMSQVADVVKTNSWKMVYAKNDAQFDALWKDMNTKVKGLGVDKIITWAQTNYATALEEAKKYK